MCFTLAGRIQTRLIALAGPLVLLAALAGLTNDPSYLGLFALMAALGLALDLLVYHWLVGFQPRWLTLLFGALELGLLSGLMLLAAPAGAAPDLGRAAAIYAVAWGLGWLVTHAALPLAFPRWAEDGGELWRGWSPARHTTVVGGQRAVLAQALTGLAVLLLPWAAAAALTPVGQRFTGALLPGQEQALGATGALLHRPASAIGADPLALAGVLWLVAALGAVLLVTALRGAASRAWQPAAALLLVVWGAAWAGVEAGPPAYLDEGRWRAAAWLRTAGPPGDIAAAPGAPSVQLAALSGRRVVTAGEPAALRLEAGQRCAALGARFWYNDVCLIEQ